MSGTVRVTLPDGSVREVPRGTTARAVAESIGAGLARAALAARVDGAVWDLDRPVDHDVALAILTERDPEALEVLRHSAAHLMAAAILEEVPGAQLTIGPVTEDGFYYDIFLPDGATITESDFPRIEARMKKIAKAGAPFERCVASSSEPYKIRANLERTGLLELFDGRLFSAHQVQRGKPAPDLFLRAADELGVDPGACAVVEDTAVGVQAALAAGMRAFGYCGHFPRETMRAAGAVPFEAMAELPPMLARRC